MQGRVRVAQNFGAIVPVETETETKKKGVCLLSMLYPVSWWSRTLMTVVSGNEPLLLFLLALLARSPLPLGSKSKS